MKFRVCVCVCVCAQCSHGQNKQHPKPVLVTNENKKYCDANPNI